MRNFLKRLFARAPGRSRSETRLLLIDDDPIFGRILHRLAETRGLRLAHWSSLEGKDPALLASFDLLIVDYELEHITGRQLLSLLPRGSRIPILLVSAYGLLARGVLPPGVGDFVAKSEGADKILDTALRLGSKSAR